MPVGVTIEHVARDDGEAGRVRASVEERRGGAREGPHLEAGVEGLGEHRAARSAAGAEDDEEAAIGVHART